MAANVSLPNTLTNGQPNDAAPLMADLNALVNWINTNAVHLDGAKAMTGELSGTGADPVSANQYSRKQYVDNQDTATAVGKQFVGCEVKRTAAQSIPNGTMTAISFDGETSDTDAYFAATSTNITIPANRGGTYAIAQKGTTSGIIGDACFVFVNGVAVSKLDLNTAPDGGALNASTWYPLANITVVATDVVTFRVIQNSGSAQNFTVAGFRISRVSA